MSNKELNFTITTESKKNTGYKQAPEQLKRCKQYGNKKDSEINSGIRPT
jgi:hypothetical protein